MISSPDLAMFTQPETPSQAISTHSQTPPTCEQRVQEVPFKAMLRICRHFLLLLIAFAIIGGTTSELAYSAQYIAPMTMAGMPCDMAIPASASGDTKPMPPCKGMTPDCIKLMGCVLIGCVTVTALPTGFLTHEITVRYSTVTYWTGSSTPASLDHEPEPFPPRTI